MNTTYNTTSYTACLLKLFLGLKFCYSCQPNIFMSIYTMLHAVVVRNFSSHMLDLTNSLVQKTKGLRYYPLKLKTVNLSIKINKFIDLFLWYLPHIVSFTLIWRWKLLTFIDFCRPLQKTAFMLAYWIKSSVFECCSVFQVRFSSPYCILQTIHVTPLPFFIDYPFHRTLWRINKSSTSILKVSIKKSFETSIKSRQL